MAAPLPLRFLVLLFAGRINRHQEAVIDYLREENRVLREVHGKKRLRFTDDQRRRLAVKGKALGRRVLGEVGSLVTPGGEHPLGANSILLLPEHLLAA